MALSSEHEAPRRSAEALAASSIASSGGIEEARRSGISPGWRPGLRPFEKAALLAGLSQKKYGPHVVESPVGRAYLETIDAARIAALKEST